MSHPGRSSLIHWFNSRRNSREGREDWEDPEFDPNWRVGPDIHQISPVRPWPSLSKGTLLWWTWIWWRTKSGLKGHRLGVWWGWCEGWESGPQDFIGMIKTQPFEKWSQWKAKRSWKECRVDLCWEAGSREHVVFPCFPCYLQNEINRYQQRVRLTPKRRYIGPQRWYVCTSVHLPAFGHILNQSCRSNVESPSCSVEHNVTSKIVDVFSYFEWPSKI